MGDGHLGECKVCTRKIRKTRWYNPAKRRQIAEYERTRYQRRKRTETYRRNRIKYKKRHPEKIKARSLVQYAIKKGELIKEPCMECNNKKVEAHHKDYNKPLEVQWLCRKHHLLEEGKQPF